MENETQNTMDNPVQSNEGALSNKPADSGSIDSTPQAGESGGDDWQEEVYQKIQSLKESYLAVLTEIHQKFAIELEQHDESLPREPMSEHLEKMKIYKTMLERFIAFLQVSKGNVVPSFKEKLASYEKQIIHFANTNNRPKIDVFCMQQNKKACLQHNSIPSISGLSTTQPNMISSMEPDADLDSTSVNCLKQVGASNLQQTSVNAPQVTNSNLLSSQGGGSVLHPQVQSHENPMKSQILATNLWSSAAKMPQNNMPIQSFCSVPFTFGLHPQQNLIDSKKSGATLDSIPVNSLKQVGASTLEKNSLNAPQQTNTKPLSLQGGASVLQPNLNPLQPGSSTHPLHQLKQAPQMLKNLQHQQWQKLALQKQPIWQHLQFPNPSSFPGGATPSVLQHNPNPLLPVSGQLHLQQLKQLQEQQMLQSLQLSYIIQLLQGSAASDYSQHQQFKSGFSFPVSSPRHPLQAASPQVPQVDRQSANSTFVGPTPPVRGDPQKPVYVVSSDAARIGHEKKGIASVPARSVAIGIPEISTPLLAKLSGPSAAHGGDALAAAPSAKFTAALLFSLIFWLVFVMCVCVYM